MSELGNTSRHARLLERAREEAKSVFLVSWQRAGTIPLLVEYLINT